MAESRVFHIFFICKLDIENTSQQLLPYSAQVKLCTKCNGFILTKKKGNLVVLSEQVFFFDSRYSFPAVSVPLKLHQKFFVLFFGQ